MEFIVDSRCSCTMVELLLTFLHCGVALTFPIDQGAEAVEGEQFKVHQTLRICGANLHFEDV